MANQHRVPSPSTNALGGSGGNGVTFHPGSERGGAGHVVRSGLSHAPSPGRGSSLTWLFVPRVGSAGSRKCRVIG